MRLDNAHIGDTGTPQPSPSPAPEFETRPSVNVNYRLGASGGQYNSDYYFIEQATQFDRWIRFSPRGEAVVKGGEHSDYAVRGGRPSAKSWRDLGRDNQSSHREPRRGSDKRLGREHKNIPAMNNSLRSSAAFSLVEVTLALGIAALSLVAVLGLVPVAALTNRNATSQTAATNVIASVIADMRATTSSTSPQYGITFGMRRHSI